MFCHLILDAHQDIGSGKKYIELEKNACECEYGETTRATNELLLLHKQKCLFNKSHTIPDTHSKWLGMVGQRYIRIK